MSDDTEQQPIDGQVIEQQELTVAGNPKPWSRRSPDELTVKQLTFAQAVIAGKSLSDAYKLAYDTSKMNPKTIYTRGYQLRHNHDKIRQLIDDAKQQIAAKVQVDRSYVLEALHHSAETALARRTMKLRKVVNGEAVEVEQHLPDRSAANRALELLGKEAGMFVDRREVGRPGEFAAMERAELESMIRDMLALDNGQDTDK